MQTDALYLCINLKKLENIKCVVKNSEEEHAKLNEVEEWIKDQINIVGSCKDLKKVLVLLDGFENLIIT